MADTAIPAVVQRNVAELEGAVTNLRQQLRLLISSDSQESIALLSPVNRASYFLALSKVLNTLFCWLDSFLCSEKGGDFMLKVKPEYVLRQQGVMTVPVNEDNQMHLRTRGVSPEKHRVTSELERVSIYHDKVASAVDRSQAPSRPTVAIDVPAANRFIEHAIPDLTEEQKKQVRELGKGNGKKQNRRKRGGSGEVSGDLTHSKKKQSIGEAAAAFLAEASNELLATQQAKPADKHQG